VFGYLGDVRDKTILDLGAGVGQWAFRFVERRARHITAVEYSPPLAEVGRREATRRGVDNVDFVVCSAEEFTSTSTFDIVMISGLFVYLNDDQAELLVQHLPAFCHASTIVLVRDGTGINGRHEINDRFSRHLHVNYSATYRTAGDFERMFTAQGFALNRHENMFEEGCVLNKYPETRLRIYEFKRPGLPQHA
jgi:cyclopropane fatty-acyl-phospholipid synthase-like methyltransferase